MLTAPKKLVSTESMAVDVVSPVQQLDNAFGFSVQAVFTTVGSLGGTLSLEASVNHQQDSQGNVLVAGDWDTIANSSQIISGAGSFTWNYKGSMFPYFRVRYAHAGGDSGSLNVWVDVRGF